jgi:hypothetical protein
LFAARRHRIDERFLVLFEFYNWQRVNRLALHRRSSQLAAHWQLHPLEAPNAALGVSIGAVKAKVFHGRKKLREALKLYDHLPQLKRSSQP